MLILILKGGNVITGKTKKDLEINMKNDNVFTEGESLEEYKKGVVKRVLDLYGYIIDKDNFIDSLVEHNLARVVEEPEG